MPEEFDYVIVGAGSAGCVVALRLSEAGKTVCVLEAGPTDKDPYIQIPAGYVKNIFSTTRTWNFLSEGIPGSDGRQIKLVQGRGVGGSSAINGLIYNRGQPDDFNTWAQKGNPGWGYEDVVPYFKRSERRIGKGDARYRGFDGPLTVTDAHSRDPLCDMFVKAATSLGFPYTDDYNGDGQEGVGTWQFTIDTTGRWLIRQSAARAFLKPALKTGRVSLRANSSATRILFRDGEAVGVEYRKGGKGGPVSEVRARREVILSSGALNSPRLLQISGVGPKEHLRSLGVEVIRDIPGVGANLSDHFQLRVATKVRGLSTVNERGRGIPLAWEIAKWAAGRPSLLGMAPTLMRLFFRSDPALDNPDLQISFTPGSYQEGIPGLLDRYPGITLGGHQQRPESRGFVRARSTDIDVQPAIQPNYLSTEADQKAIIQIVRTARRILHTPTFAPHVVEEVFPGSSVQSDSEILDFARKRGGTVYHHTGTARMGPDGDAGAVVDPRLRVRGLRGLRVVDASIMPTPISGPTNAASIMIGEKGADLILEDEKAA
ncbi:MAG: GMC family oxidoreductase N-terminal domain-containing protein [Rhizobiaceae bacterium]|nr:GMC family oxidoreductase N-terminal domain-containing protein [Rhizobiaceae bacterium]